MYFCHEGKVGCCEMLCKLNNVSYQVLACSVCFSSLALPCSVNGEPCFYLSHMDRSHGFRLLKQSGLGRKT